MSLTKSNNIALTISILLGVANLIFFAVVTPHSAQALSPTVAPTEDTIAPLPASGSAPLEVMFDVVSKKCSSGLVVEGSFRVSFGDGETYNLNGCPMGERIYHTYSTNGSYTASLQFLPFGPASANYQWETLKSTTITVGNTTTTYSSYTLTASPTSGDSPLKVTFSHNIAGNQPGGWKLEFGDGNSTTPASCYAPTDYCISPGTNTYTYASAGNYVVKLVDNTGKTVADTTIIVGSDTTSSGYTLTASPTSGDSPLKVTFSHNIAGNQPAGWRLEFGDGNSVTPTSCYAPTDFCITSGTNTYTYTSPGSYVAKLIDNSGNTVDKVTVRVSDEEEEEEDEDDMRQQLITLIKALITQLQSQGKSVSVDVSNTGSSNSGTSGSCVDISSPLYVGANDRATNGDVTRLQNFLRATGDFTYPEVTGFYGQSTLQAVQKWQARNRVVSSGTPASTGYGLVGAMTRTAMSCR